MIYTINKQNFWKFIDQFKDAMVGILLAAAVVSLVISVMNGESFVDSIASTEKQPIELLDGMNTEIWVRKR